MSARSSNLTHEFLNGEAKMRKSEIMALIANGENAKTEFKRDDARPARLFESGGLVSVEKMPVHGGASSSGTGSSNSRCRIAR